MPESLWKQNFPLFCVLCGLFPSIVFSDACHKSNITLSHFENDLEQDKGEEKNVEVNIDEFFREAFFDVFVSGKFKKAAKKIPLSRVGTCWNRIKMYAAF